MIKKIYVLLLALIVSVPSYAQVDRTKLPKAGPAPEVKIGNYESFELANGLKVFVVENHKLPRVTFNLFVDHDPVLEGANAGYVNAAGQLLRTGTKSRTKDKLDEEIDFLGASLNTSSNGVTASCLTKHTDKLMEIMSDMVLNSEFKQSELDKIVKQTLSGLATTKDDPAAIGQRLRSIVTYGKDHPYGEPQTEETVKSITLDMCNNFYQTYFKPNTAYLAIVGDINKAKAKTLVEKYLSKWEKKEVPKNTFATPKAPIVSKVQMVNRDASVQSVIYVTYPIELIPGSEDVIKASVANLILGGSATGRLFMNLRESKAYTYGAYSSLSPDENIGSFFAFTQARNSVTDSAITEIMNEMKRIRNEKVSEEDLNKAISYLSGNFIRELESPGTIARFAINTARFNLPKDYYKNYLKNLAAVTIDDVQEAARKYIKPNNANILVVGNAEQVAKNITRFSISGKLDYYDVWGNTYDPNVKKVPEGVTVESVLNKYVEVIGGKENIQKVKDRTTKMAGSVQGMNLTITMTQKYPNKLYQSIDAGAFQQKTVFDGEKGKAEGMGQTREITGDQLEMMKSGALDAMLDYSKFNIKPELTGMETINGKDAYRVTLAYPTGTKTTQYYSVETGFMIRTVSQMSGPQGSVTQTTDMDDYKEVQGMKYPFKYVQSFGPQIIDLTVTSIEVNTGVADSLFEVK